MTLPLASIALAFVLVLLTKAPVGKAMKELGAYDNAEPRVQQARLTGWGGRALAAHLNSIEAFPPFAAAVLVAHVARADATIMTGLCAAFLLARVAYPVVYIAGKGALRSAVWGVGWLSTLGLFLSPLLG
jgi:uncharacterized MAPEG superfamily protein